MKRQVEAPIVIDGEIAYIELTHGLFAIIDAEDIPKVRGQNWHRRQHGLTFYAFANRKRDGKNAVIRLHHLILPPVDGFEVDHKNGNGLDNRKANLRLATHQENSRNRGIASNNTSGAKGVVWEASSGKWRARIGMGPRRICLGRYKNILDAERAYIEASRRLYGEFSREAFFDQPPQGKCNNHTPATAEVQAARVAWLEKAV